ncbi:MAG: hypothetical protein GXY40_02350 [Syntrophomonadaceae bacterium]|nr:hypothetical protein [Syntrophomonadaceae bacterium]
MNINDFIYNRFGVSVDVFMEALRHSPGSVGGIAGAISEILLKIELEKNGYEALRIKEKPAGGNDAKAKDAKGDFFIRKQDISDNWYVLECKGLKTNSEFRGGKLSTKKSVYNFLGRLAFPESNEKIYNKGYATYLKAKAKYEKNNKDKTFPPFNWDINYPGPNSVTLSGIWQTKSELKEWVYSQDDLLFTEESYRKQQGIIVVLETHKPNIRVSPSGIEQTAPLVADFSILAVDLFFRTGKHEFVFMNPETISHSPSSPEHLYQNYIIDVIIPGLKDRPVIKYPWYSDIDELIKNTNPSVRQLDESQLDNRISTDFEDFE